MKLIMDPRKVIYFFLFLLAAIIGSVFSECDENGVWMRHYSFGKSKDMTINWNFTNETITMAMIGKTKGYVVVGFSASPKSLNDTDIVIGWVDDETNKTYLQDRHGDAKNQSLMDDQNSYELLEAKQNSSHTIICWKRNLETCDKEDFRITFSTIRVFWAIGEKDPENENFEVPVNLGSKMGVQSLRLLSYEYPDPNSPDIESIDFVAPNVIIKTDPTGTVYWCTHFTLPISKKRSHVVSIEPVIQEENADIFHHYLLYECPISFMKNFNWFTGKDGYNCFDYSKFAFQDLCISVLNGWAVGATRVNYPPDIGFPFHSTETEKFYMLQSHYNVRNLKAPRKDHSGIRIHFTYNLRKKEAAMIGLGTNVSPFQLIPPGQKSFINIGVCSKHCTESTIPENGIEIISVIFHSHLAGKALTVRRIRDGNELEPLEDESYDFDYQQQSFLVKPFIIMPGDELISECSYDTSKRNYTTVGAFGTSEEMCLILLFYVNHANLTWCVSYLPPLDVFNLTDVKALLPIPKFCWGSPECESIYAAQGVPNLMGTVALPLKDFGKKLVDYLRDYKWTSSKIKSLQDMYYKDQIPFCRTDEISFNSTSTSVAPYPDFIPYKKPDICATNSK